MSVRPSSQYHGISSVTLVLIIQNINLATKLKTLTLKNQILETESKCEFCSCLGTMYPVGVDFAIVIKKT
jgi:hypothetical protein